MAKTFNLPRFVTVDFASYQKGTPQDNTLYFISDLGVIYQGSNLVTKGVQTDNSKKVPGLFYILGTGKDAQIVTYASADAEPTVVALSENAIEGMISDAVDAAKDEINGAISGEGGLTGRVGALEGRMDTAEGEIDDLQAAFAKMNAEVDAKGEPKNNGIFVVSGVTQVDGVITAVDSVEVEQAGAAAQALEDAKEYTDLAIQALDSSVAAEGTPAKDGVFVLSGVTQTDGKLADKVSIEVEKAGAAAEALEAANKYTDDEIKEISDRLDGIVGDGSGLDLTSLNNRVTVVEGTLATHGDIVTHSVAEFEKANAAAEAEARINAKLGGNFGTGEGQQTVDAAIKAVDDKFASYSTSTQVDEKINVALASVLKFKGVVADKPALEAITGMVEGDVYYVTAESKEFVYVDEDGKKGWEELGASVDYTGMLAPYLLIGDTFTAGEILVASVDGDAKSAKTTGYKAGGATFEDDPVATTLATEKAVADIFAQLEWKNVMD